MPQCAGCGKNVCSNEPKVTLNKVWHKCCFRCHKCNCELNVDFARVYKSKIYCHACFKILRKVSCSFDGEDEAVNLEESCDPCCNISCSSYTFCKLTPRHSEDCLTCKRRRDCCRSGNYAIPRELANYCNRNPLDERNATCPVVCKNRVRPCVLPLYQCNNKNRSRSYSCLYRAFKSLLRRRDNTDSCDSCEKCRHICDEPKYGCSNKLYCDGNRCNKCLGCTLCRRCGHKVYAAEIVLTSYGAYHNSCFSCYSCLKPLDATNVEEHCGEIFCRRCYKKHFGFKNFGFRNRVS